MTKPKIPKPSPADPVASSDGQTPGTADARHRDIATAAYHRGQARGFAPGGELEDWLEAQREMEAPWAGMRRAAPCPAFARV